jgi:hypothetical protein
MNDQDKNISVDDIKNITDEISKLKNQGVVLNDKLDVENIVSQYELIDQQSKKGRNTLPRSYAFIKRLQYAIHQNLYNQDVKVFIELYTVVETIRRRLGNAFEVRKEIYQQVKNIKKIIGESN